VADSITAVSRRIAAPATDIFGVLTDPRRHVELDGSGMVRGAVTGGPVHGVGDVFVMAMHFPALGDYQMENRVVEYERDRRIGWEPAPGLGHPAAGQPPAGHRWTFALAPDGDATIVTEVYDCSRAPTELRASVDDGKAWVAAMAATLEHLDQLCTRGAAG
jgi:hypothetical protein